MLKTAVAMFCVGSLLPVVGRAQAVKPDHIRKMCEPIIFGAVTEKVNIDRSVFDRQASKAWLCSQTFQSEEEASKAGINVGVPLEGVEIGLLFSSDATKRKTARQKLCTGSSMDASQAYSIIVSRLKSDPVASQRYASCVSQAMRTNDDLSCYFDPVNDPNNMALEISYRPASTRIGRLSSPPQLRGATVTGTPDIVQRIRSTQQAPFNPSRALTPFVLSIPIERTGTQGGSFSLSLTDGQSASCQFSSLPAQLSVIITPVGQSLSRLEGRFSYRLADNRDCGNDVYNRTASYTLPAGQYLVTAQDYLSQIFLESSNCPMNASTISGVRGTSDTSLAVDYRLVGCGQNFWGCKGSGWIGAYGYAKTRSVDRSAPAQIAHSETREFVSGAIEPTQIEFVQAVESDFRLQDFEFIASARIPMGSSYRQIVLKGRATNNAESKVCEDWTEDGKPQSLMASINMSGLLTVFQSSKSCEGYKAEASAVDSTIRGVTPEGTCTNRRDGLVRLTPGESITPEKLFGRAARCGGQ